MRLTPFLAGLNLLIGKCSWLFRVPEAGEPLVPGQFPRRDESPRHDEPRYLAFLSYSHGDAGVAKRVSARLEGFRIDRELVGRPARGGRVPEALRPIFRNRRKFYCKPSLGDAALGDSATLIVLASPESLRSSKYLKRQFRLFKLRHPERPVILLSIEGTPGGPKERRLRPAMRFVVAPGWAQSPADALPLDRYPGDEFELAIAKTAAWLIGLSAPEVCRRARAAQRRRTRIGIAMAATIALLGTAGGALFWQSHQRKVAWAEAAALIDRYELASPTQAADPGARQSLAQAAAAIAECAATDSRCAEALELSRGGKIAEAARPLKVVAEGKAKKSPKDGAVAFRNLASIAAIADPGSARKYYAEAARLDPANIGVMFRNAWLQQQAGQLDVAEASYRRVIASATARNNEWVLWAQFGRGEIERERSHLDDALATYHEAAGIAENLVEADPGNMGWQYDLGISNERIGDLLMALGDHAQALKYYRTQREILTRLANGGAARATADTSMGKEESTQDDLSEVLETFRANVANLERLAKSNLVDAGWQRDLAVSHERVGRLLAWQGNLPEAQKSFSASLAIIDRLARIDPGNIAWQRELGVSYVSIGDVLTEQYDLANALKSYQAGVAIADRLAEADPGNARWQRELSAIHSKVGDLLAEQDRPAEALKSHRASLAVAERLAMAEPGDSRLQRELSATYRKVGHALVDQRNLPEALKFYQASLAITAGLAEADPHDARRQSELSEIYDTVGDVLKEQGDLPEAVKYYQASLDISERLTETAGDAARRRDLAAIYRRRGNILKGQGNLPEALKSYQTSLQFAERPTKTNPVNAIGQRDLAATYRGIGDILKAQSNLPGALISYRAAFDISARLAESDSANALSQHDLAAAYSALGDVLEASGDLPEALKSFSASLAIAERLTGFDPGDASRQRDLAIAYGDVGKIRRSQGDLTGALQSYQASVTIMGRAAKGNPGNASWQRDLSAMYNRVGDVLKAQGRLGEAVKSYQASVAIKDRLARIRPSA